MKLTTKRHISAWMLLAVFVPMLLISSLHIHEESETAEEACAECVHHHCYGHLSQLTTTMHQCILCQFLTLSFVASSAITLVVYNKVMHLRLDARQRNVSIAHKGIVGLRAPPVFSI
ncbi:MAG: hypothetical protein J5663_03825 [Bacteroidaceae bacterium]|nr:hypothetical protein [Bacteroidaceae bacterium]